MAHPSGAVTRLDYCQFLLSSQINYTLTHFADHAQKWSHDTVNRYLRGEKIPPRLVWEHVREEVVPSEEGYLVFDDTVLDKRYAHKMELVRRQWSGNAKGVISGIGVVTCVYVNPELDRFWIIDYRIYAPEQDGKSKLDHVGEMFTNAAYQKPLPFRTVLMDTWYATMQIMKQIERAGKLYYCPVKRNRLTDDSGGETPHKRVEHLSWSADEERCGKLVHVKKFPKGHRVRLFRLVLSTERTDYVITNDVAQDSADATQEACGVRWKIEQFHREAKQLTGIESCQCRSARIQRNHIGCAMLVWVRLKAVAHEHRRSMYALKHGLLSDYLIQQLRDPSISMATA